MFAFLAPVFETGVVQEFAAQPIDTLLIKILLSVGWIPILFVFIWAAAQIWMATRQGIYSSKLKWIVLAIDVPRMTEQSPKAMENVFSTLLGAKSSIMWKEKWLQGKFQPSFSFEIVSNGGFIQFYVRTLERFRDIVEAGIYAQYPDAEIMEVEDYVDTVPSNYPNDDYDMWGTELTLKKPEYFPIRTYPEFEHSLTQELKDPLGVILEQMGRMVSGEHMWIQIVARAGSQDWKDAGEKFVNKVYGIEETAKPGFISSVITAILWLPSEVIAGVTGFSFLGALGMGGSSVAEDGEADPFKAFRLSVTEKKQAELVADKSAKLGMKCKFRILYFGKHEVYKKAFRTAIIKGMFQQFTHQNTNGFGLVGSQTPKDDYFWMLWTYHHKQSRLTRAYKGRSYGVGAEPVALNTEELATIYHFPAINIKAPLVKKTEARKAEPPTNLPIAVVGEVDLPGGPTQKAHEAVITEDSPFTEPIITPEFTEPVVPVVQSPTHTEAEHVAQQVEPIPEEVPAPVPQPSAHIEPTPVPQPLVAYIEPAPVLQPSIQTKPAPVPQPLVAHAPTTSSHPAISQTATTHSTKAEPPLNLPIEKPAQAAPPVVKHKIPDAMRVLLEPGVQLEDVGLAQRIPENNEDEGVPKNLPI